MKGRDYTLDIIRILACFLVVLLHAPMPTEKVNGPFIVCLIYMTMPCIGLFFMVSGTLLLPVKTNYFSFIRKRFSKIAVPTIIWSLTYIGLKCYYNESEISVLRSLASLPLSHQESVLWFMYTLSGLYLLAPIISPGLEKLSKRELQFVLVIWGITLCYGFLEYWLQIDTSTIGILYYFTGYCGYFILGYYLKKYPKSISTVSTIICCAIAVLGAFLILIFKIKGITFSLWRLSGYLSIFIAAYCVMIWKVIKVIVKIFRKFKKRQGWILVGGGKSLIKKVLSLLSNVSFGIYLIHILIMRRWLYNQDWIHAISNYPLQCFTIAILTFIISAVICIIISRLPKAEWLIGFKYRR